MIAKFLGSILASGSSQHRLLAGLRWTHPLVVSVFAVGTGNMSGLMGIWVISCAVWWFDRGKVVREWWNNSSGSTDKLTSHVAKPESSIRDFVGLHFNAAILKRKVASFIDENCTYRLDGEVLPWAKLVHLQETLVGWRLDFHIDSDQRTRDFSNRAGLMGRKIFGSDLPVKVVHARSGVIEVHFSERDILAEKISGEILAASGTDPMEAKCVAISETGLPVTASMAHTLVVGATGSGKGSVLWAYIRALLPSARAGTAVFYGIDPKRTELKGCEALFQQLAFTHEETADILDRILAVMRQRQAQGGRKFIVSKSNPLIFLAIDEFAAMTVGADRDTKKRIEASFLLIMSQGRSAGIAVLAMAQQPQKEVLGNIRAHFVLRVGLRLETSLETSMVFGEGMADLGVGCHQISAATAANNYATAGIGWALHESDGLVKVRFPYTSDEEIEDILKGAVNWNEHGRTEH